MKHTYLGLWLVYELINHYNGNFEPKKKHKSHKWNI